MSDTLSRKGLTRRQLLSSATAAGASFVVGSGFLAAPDGAWGSLARLLDTDDTPDGLPPYGRYSGCASLAAPQLHS